MGIFGNGLKKWAENNNLKYQKKLKLGFIRSENVSIKDLIWGKYNGKKIYIFKISNNEGSMTNEYFFFNGMFYSKIKHEDIDKLLENKNHLDQKTGIFGYETNIEISQTIVAHIYLNSGTEVEYGKVAKVYKLLKKYYNSKVSLKDRITGNLMGKVRSDIKFNSPEAISFVAEKYNDRNIIEMVANTYEKLLANYNSSN